MRLTISVLSLLLFPALLVAEPPVEADVVVATTGSGDNPGTAAKAFAALARARDVGISQRWRSAPSDGAGPRRHLCLE